MPLLHVNALYLSSCAHLRFTIDCRLSENRRTRTRNRRAPNCHRARTRSVNLSLDWPLSFSFTLPAGPSTSCSGQPNTASQKQAAAAAANSLEWIEFTSQTNPVNWLKCLLWLCWLRAGQLSYAQTRCHQQTERLARICDRPRRFLTSPGLDRLASAAATFSRNN